MPNRAERRAAAHQARKAARKAGFPTPVDAEAAIPNRTASPTELDPPPSTSPSPVTKISAARLSANRANALLSSGPKSQATKAISSQNRLTHGLARHNGTFTILPTEDPLGFEALRRSLAEEHCPSTETESILVNGMAESHWLAQRAQNLQATCFDPSSGAITNEKLFSLYLRYQTTHSRAFHKSFNDLLKLRSERRKADLGFEAQKQKAAESRFKNEGHEIKNKLLRLDLLEKDPLFNADYKHLTHLASTSSPEFKRAKAEFDAKYFARKEEAVAA